METKRNEMEDQERSLQLLPVVRRRYALDDPFFHEGNVDSAQHCKWAYVAPAAHDDDDDDDDDAAAAAAGGAGGDVPLLPIRCGISGCERRFRSHRAWENHYQGAHRHRCARCARVFPTARLVELHLREVRQGVVLLAEQVAREWETKAYLLSEEKAEHLYRKLKYRRTEPDDDVPSSYPSVVGKSSRTKTAGRSSDRGLYLADLTNRAHASIWDSYLGSLKSDGLRSKPKPSPPNP